LIENEGSVGRNEGTDGISLIHVFLYADDGKS